LDDQSETTMSAITLLALIFTLTVVSGRATNLYYGY
jgi:hypothetical protein